MRKYIIICLLCFQITLLIAQKSGIEIGLNGVLGLTKSGISTARYTYMTGINLNIPLKNKYYLQTGINYLDKGYRIVPIRNQPIGIDPVVIEPIKVYHYHYLSVPITFYSKWGSNGRFFTRTGLNIAYLAKTSVNEVGEKGLFPPPPPQKMDRIGVGADIGIGYYVFRKNNIHISVELYDNATPHRDPKKPYLNMNFFGLRLNADYVKLNQKKKNDG